MEARGIDLPIDIVMEEVKKLLVVKLMNMQEFISSMASVHRMYEKVDYYHKYPRDFLDPEDFQRLLNKKIEVVVGALE